jgi:RNA-directed DNA polymerase
MSIIIKLDIQGFFMHINRVILFERIHMFLERMYLKDDKALVIEICKRIIFNDPVKDCLIKGSRKNWEGLPPSKSLFIVPKIVDYPLAILPVKYLPIFT